MTPRHLLRVLDVADELNALLDLSAETKRDPERFEGALRARSIACFFEKPSTRTRVSFAAAAHRLGMLPIMLRPDELQLARGETVADTARVLSSYVSALVARTFSHQALQELADASSIPVVNALSDLHHPCQALADLLTLRERFGDLKDVKVAYVGDGNNVAHSLLEAAAATGMDIALACPAGGMPSRDVVHDAREVADRTGSEIAIVTEPGEAVDDARAVYTDVWVSMGDVETEERTIALRPYRVTPELMQLARADAVFMHCLPAHRGEEVDAAVIDGPRSVIWEQSANRLPTEQAILYEYLRDERP